MAIRKFLLVSVIFHLVLFSGLYFVPETKIKKAKELITSLVTPEELKKPEIRVGPLPKTVPRPIPRQKAFPGPRPAPPLTRMTPIRPALPREEPVVPGEGKDSGKPFPEGKRPEEAEEGKIGGNKGKGDSRDAKSSATPEKPGFSVARSLKEITESMGAKAYSGRRDMSRKDATITFDTEDYRYAGYMRLLRQKIESIWVYPPEAAAKGIYGDLKIQFTIKKDGRLGAIDLVRGSGHKMLDDAAMKALKDGEPYWPLPDSWGKDSYTILGHFVYVYGGYYIQ